MIYSGSASLKIFAVLVICLHASADEYEVVAEHNPACFDEDLQSCCSTGLNTAGDECFRGQNKLSESMGTDPTTIFAACCLGSTSDSAPIETTARVLTDTGSYSEGEEGSYGGGSSYSSYSNTPTPAPTPTPTAAPTASPTSGCTSNCEVQASITWKGMPAGTVIPKEPFKDTLMTVYSITRPDIIDVSQSSALATIRRLSGRRLSGSGRRLSTTEDVTMTYKLAAADGAQAAALEEVAQELVTSSAAREGFTSTLVTNAANVNSDNFDPVAL